MSDTNDSNGGMEGSTPLSVPVGRTPGMDSVVDKLPPRPTSGPEVEGEKLVL